MEHVAIQDPKQTYGNFNCLDVLCRPKPTKHPPYDKVQEGDTIYIQKKGGPITVKATVFLVVSKPYDDIEEIRELCKWTPLYAARLWWGKQKGSGYATVVRLSDHKDVKPAIFRKNVARGNAHDWIVLDTPQKRKQWPGLP